MLTLKPTIALLLLLLQTLSTTAQTTSTTTTQANCTVFNWNHNAAYLKTYAPQRVSGASTCADNNNRNLTCALTAAGDAMYSAQTNLTALSATFISVVDETVGNATLSEEFSRSIAGAIDGTRMLRPGQSAYLNFTAYRYCYTGTVDNCTSGVENRTAVEACAPLYHLIDEKGEEGRAVMDGMLSVVNVSRGAVGQFKDPYENQARGDAVALGTGVGKGVGRGWWVVVGGLGAAVLL
ncbi:uncharacterized protein BO97DRAFT_462509 [Aspergillus homomorphus CBS 101889]|uniref:Uncharacterized protein n=1 Tax=Aspergillus homomorphus (strain CBS 101889) TaxID=1450537 RepID=A0A395HJU6_ASPHC|nr:hypothetical protein BO97DRAFT_462509 [Aspergillus homomorphus CBS 101889]RAL07886.1 hypothetical protein BO97DRAFT_462509 [Aspergillus homomorphus CBS 101889]